jgi:hypothetical protein
MSNLVDEKLYNKLKEKIWKKYPKHSAYRSGILVKTYKKEFTKKYGKNKKPYYGNKNKTQKRGLKRWFDEKWVNQRGEVGYKYKGDIYRPSKRITVQTPITHKELSEKLIRRARNEKKTKGRVKKFKVGGSKTRKLIKPKLKNNYYYFEDYPDFKPNLSPQQIFTMGSFGGTYWRPIYSRVTNKKYKNQHKKYPTSWWENIPDDWLTTPFEQYNKSINKYGVKVGTTLEFWEKKNWIKPTHPYGWIQWYCDFFTGKRSSDDKRQINRWKQLAGEKGRFRNHLITLIINKNGDFNDKTISPKIRQTLQHWAYKLTKSDFEKNKKTRK